MNRGAMLAGVAALGLMIGGAVLLATAPVAKAQANQKALPALDTKDAAAARPWKRYSGWKTRDESKFNTLAHLASPPAPKEPRKLPAGITGNAANGTKLVANRKRGGSCLACHVMGPAGGANLPGNVAPDLSHFSGIVPCGVSGQGLGVTSLADLGRPASMQGVDQALRAAFEPLFGVSVPGHDVVSTENRSPGRRSAKSAELASR